MLLCDQLKFKRLPVAASQLKPSSDLIPLRNKRVEAGVDSNVKIKRSVTFVEVLDARVVQGLCDDFLQTVFAASAAGIHLHVAEAQLLQDNTQMQQRGFSREEPKTGRDQVEDIIFPTGNHRCSNTY